ncbi:hypothetical protein H5410_059571 [Solanum commersonii]|uniref:Uncharacterized protein n=1 Tax=Solanum commersonii TaxID=4109 RepID=A0A9J5W2S8_SOLCO|nr:hypothetical protein H5410_059571 [Solanum commersonii]
MLFRPIKKAKAMLLADSSKVSMGSSKSSTPSVSICLAFVFKTTRFSVLLTFLNFVSSQNKTNKLISREYIFIGSDDTSAAT